jgi:hypothetical protein
MKRLSNFRQFIEYFKTLGTKERSPHIYIIHEREFIRVQEQTYKIGETEKPHRRFSGYPKSSQLMYLCPVKDSRFVEQAVKKRFGDLFIQKQEYGIEYFNGAISIMMNEIDRIVCQCNMTTNFNTGLRFFLKPLHKPLPQRPTLIKRRFKPLPICPPLSQLLNKSKCPICLKYLSTPQRLRSHLSKKIPCDLKCRICNIPHPTAAAYKYHQEIIHQNIKKSQQTFFGIRSGKK